MLEEPPPAIPKKPVSLKPMLETNPEVTSSIKKGSEPIPPKPMDELVTYQMQPEEALRPSHRFYYGKDIPDIDKNQAKELWESVHDKVQELLSSINTPPPSKIHFNQPLEKGFENLPFHEKVPTRASTRSKHTLYTMSSYLGENKGHSTVLKIPSTRIELPKEWGMGNLLYPTPN